MSRISNCCISVYNAMCCKKETWQKYDADKWNRARSPAEEAGREGKADAKDDKKEAAWQRQQAETQADPGAPDEGQPAQGQPARRRCCRISCGRPSSTTLAGVAGVITAMAGLGIFKMYQALNDAHAVIDQVKTDFRLTGLDYQLTPSNRALIQIAASPKEQELRTINRLTSITLLPPADENIALLMKERGLLSVKGSEGETVGDRSVVVENEMIALEHWIRELPRALNELNEKKALLERAESERAEGFRKAIDSKEQTIQCQQTITDKAEFSVAEKVNAGVEMEKLKSEAARLQKQYAELTKQHVEVVKERDSLKKTGWFT